MQQRIILKKVLIILIALTPISCKHLSKTEKEIVKVHFDESARKEVVHDSYVARLRYEKTGKDSIKLQNHINKKIKEGLKISNSISDLKVSTLNYSVSKQWNEKTKKYTGMWNVGHDIEIDSENKESLLKAAGNLQRLGFIMKDLSSYLSKDKKAEYKNELLVEALKRGEEKAKVIAKQLGKQKVRMVDVSIDGASSYLNKKSLLNADYHMSKMFSEEELSPSIQPSTEEISTSVSVDIEIE